MTDKPLTPFMWAALRDLKHGPQPRQEFNSGVAGAIEARGLAEVYLGKTPYRTRKGDIQWLRLTEAGARMIDQNRG